jgi:hypothetical protein
MEVHSVVIKRNKNPQKGHGFERCSRSWFLGGRGDLKPISGEPIV